MDKANIFSKLPRPGTLACLLAAWLLLPAAPVRAQEFSYDGNRWYEVEISIFTNSPLNSAGEEVRIPERTRLAYPRELRELTPAISSYLIDFEQEATVESAQALAPGEQAPREEVQPWRVSRTDPTAGPVQDADGAPLLQPETERYGPEYRPPGEDFRLIDFSTDPFISLPPDYRQLAALWRRLEDSPEHRVLYQATWRQPVFNRGQSTAVFVRGGQRQGPHDELEGYVRLSYSGDRLDFDASLWLNTFSTVFGGLESAWQVPPQPFPSSSGEGENPAVLRPAVLRPAPLRMGEQLITDVAYMQQTRSMRSDTLHYLDHPAFGVLVQVRPYQLPDDFSLE